MSEWYIVDDANCIDLSKDGKAVEVLFNSTDAGNQYVEVPVAMILGLFRHKPESEVE